MSQRPCEGVMPEPLAYFLTWPTYGTWLPGDERGWVDYRIGWKPSDPNLKSIAKARMSEEACILNSEQRLLVEDTIGAHCQFRHWPLHAVNCRSNHVHVFVGSSIAPKQVASQFKAWCTRRLKACDVERRSSDPGASPLRSQWWAERGSSRWINDEQSLEDALFYVQFRQDHHAEMS